MIKAYLVMGTAVLFLTSQSFSSTEGDADSFSSAFDTKKWNSISTFVQEFYARTGDVPHPRDVARSTGIGEDLVRVIGQAQQTEYHAAANALLKGKPKTTASHALGTLASEAKDRGDDGDAAIAYFGVIANKFGNKCKHDDVF
jgi:hypothetical protein